MTPAPASPGRGAKFWVLVGLGAVGGCCVCSGAAVVIAGAAGSDTPPGSTAQAAEAAADDFIYASPNGLSYIASSEVVAEGVEVQLAGEWHEEHRNLVLKLGGDSRYSFSSSGGVLVGNSAGDVRANGSRSAERGTWSFEAGALTLTPDGYELSGNIGTHRVDTEQGTADAPRAWSVVGVTLEYTPHGATSARRCPALHVRGAAPSWYYPSGPMDWTLRRAPCRLE